MPGIDIARLDCTNMSFPKHYHEEFILGANIVGRENVWLERRTFDASIDDATLYNPGEVQAGHPVVGDWKFFSIYIDPAFVSENLTDKNVAFQRPVSNDRHLSYKIKCLSQNAIAGLVGDDEVREAVVALLDYTLNGTGEPSFVRTPLSSPLSSPLVRRTAERLLDDIANPPRLNVLASAEDVSPVQLVRLFTAERGLPPFAWLNIQRLSQARRLIQRDVPLSKVAAELGFADQAHFTRRFKAVYSVTPGVWARGGAQPG